MPRTLTEPLDAVDDTTIAIPPPRLALRPAEAAIALGLGADSCGS
jgi:hypothetical protein